MPVTNPQPADSSRRLPSRPVFRPQLITFFLALLCIHIPLARATAASQFHLDVHKHVSECFMECHTNFTDAYDLPGRDTNGPQLITENCKDSEWRSLMPLCLVQACASAPDAAYATEFATAFCVKAGVDLTMELPDAYKAAAAEYFQSAAYLSAGSRTYRWPEIEGVLLALGSVLLVVL